MYKMYLLVKYNSVVSNECTLLDASGVGHKFIVCWLLLARMIVHSFYFLPFTFSSFYVCTPLCTNFIIK